MRTKLETLAMFDSMASTKLTFVTSSRGKEKAILEGFIYTKEKENTERTYWRCELRCCNSRLHSRGDVVIRQPTEHRFHAPSSERVLAATVVGQVRSKATECESTRNVVQQAMSLAPVAPTLPSTSALSQIVRRKRRAAVLLEDEDNDDHEETIVPRKLQRTCDNHEFMRFQSEDMVYFASTRGMDMLNSQAHWFATGTFCVSPPSEYTQLYTIHVLLENSETIPCVFVLMKNKSEEDYASMLNVLCDHPDRVLQPESISVDFEHAAISTFKDRLPAATIHGCFFHLARSIWRQIQQSGLQILYGSDPEFALNARCLAAVAFLPTEDVVRGFEQLTLDEKYPDELDPVVAYFEYNYIGIIGRGSRRRQPTFPHSLWSQYDRIKQNFPRTTNLLEGWHSVVNKAHMPIETLVTKLRLEESSAAKKIRQLNAGHPTQKRKKKSAVDTRLEVVVDAYNSEYIVQYLRSIAHNISF